MYLTGHNVIEIISFIVTSFMIFFKIKHIIMYIYGQNCSKFKGLDWTEIEKNMPTM